MCRYGIYGPYKQHYACFRCRKAFKPLMGGKLAACPDCGGAVLEMGLDFKAPKRRDVKAWRKVEILARNGIGYYSCGCSGPGKRPRRLNQVMNFLKEIEIDPIVPLDLQKRLDRKHRHL